MNLQYVASCLFGTEGLVARELRDLGAENVRADNGKVWFEGGFDVLAKANLRCRCAERILILLGDFPARSFTELFDGVRALPLENFIAQDEAFPVRGHSLDSKLFSVPDCQAIVKKAAAERLKAAYGIQRPPETGAVLQLRFLLLKDRFTLMLDTSGEGLHKRGYRKGTGNEAPLKETLAAALVMLMRVYPDTHLIDPFCGSGTVLIEAAMAAQNIAPGLGRHFAAERFARIPKGLFDRERRLAREEIRPCPDFCAEGFDSDPEAVRLTPENARKAGVEDRVTARVRRFEDFELPEGRTLVITNPPYGERLADAAESERLCRLMGEKFARARGKRYGILSPHEHFEDLFGRPADKNRKIYNGMIPCRFYTFVRSGPEEENVRSNPDFAR